MAELNDTVIHGAVAKQTISNLSAAFSKLEKKLVALSEKVVSLEQKLRESEDETEINLLDGEIKSAREELFTNLVLKQKLEVLASRNRRRLEIVCRDAEEAAVDAVSSKEIAEFLGNFDGEISPESLGLTLDSRKFLEFRGKILILEGGTISLEEKENVDALLSLEIQDFLVVFSAFPEMVGTVSDEVLLSPLRVRLVKGISAYSFEESKEKGFEELNKKLGNLLKFDTKIPEDSRGFTDAYSNLFKVRIKRFLLEKYPNSASQIEEKIFCDEANPMLPLALRKEEKSSEANLGAEDEIEEFIKSLLGGDENG